MKPASSVDPRVALKKRPTRDTNCQSRQTSLPGAGMTRPQRQTSCGSLTHHLRVDVARLGVFVRLSRRFLAMGKLTLSGHLNTHLERRRSFNKIENQAAFPLFLFLGFSVLSSATSSGPSSPDKTLSKLKSFANASTKSMDFPISPIMFFI